jgi:hypothetical protein
MAAKCGESLAMKRPQSGFVLIKQLTTIGLGGSAVDLVE